MSEFSDRMTGCAFGQLSDRLGGTVTYTPASGSSVSLTGIWCEEETELNTEENAQVRVRTARLSFESSLVSTITPQKDTVTKGSTVWPVTGWIENAGITTVTLEINFTAYRRSRGARL